MSDGVKETLFKEIPVALEQLRSHDAHCSREVTLLLDGAQIALKNHDPARVWEEIGPIIGMLAIEANDHCRHQLPQHTLDFLDRIEDAFSHWHSPD